MGTMTWHPKLRKCEMSRIVPKAIWWGVRSLKVDGQYLCKDVACRIAYPQAVWGSDDCINKGLAISCNRLMTDSASPFWK